MTESSSTLKSADAWLNQARTWENQGELFRAYDTALEGSKLFPDSIPLKHRAVLALARAGATDLAVQKFRALGLDTAEDAEVAALNARLLKDRALVGADDRRSLLAKAGEAYRAIYRRTHDYYPGINAATLDLLSGKTEEAFATAAEVIAALNPAQLGAGDRYYPLVTLIEAHLIRGEVDDVRALLPQALAASEGRWSDILSTCRQLRIICGHHGIGDEWLDLVRPPGVLHYAGHMVASPDHKGRFETGDEPAVAAAIDAEVKAHRVGFGYGSAAGGTDLLVIEALLRQQAEVVVVLPFDRAEFVETSVRPCGSGWVERFEACLAHDRVSVRFATEDRHLGDDTLYQYASRYAMGLAMLRGKHIGVEPRQLAVWDGLPPTGPAGTAVDVAIWQRVGKPQTVISPSGTVVPAAILPMVPPPKPGLPSSTLVAPALPGRRARAMLFGDVKGFSKLTDAQLPVFVADVMGALALAIHRHRDRVLQADTWGDGLYLVFQRASEAAECALDLQAAMAALDRARLGLPEDLGLRLGGHLGPVYAGMDPVTQRQNFYGAHVSCAARIEPITPEGCVYVTEPFAASLEVDPNNRFNAHYVGYTDLAKNYGRSRMFLLSWRQSINAVN